jgi:hypothetical protein
MLRVNLRKGTAVPGGLYIEAIHNVQRALQLRPTEHHGEARVGESYWVADGESERRTTSDSV